MVSMDLTGRSGVGWAVVRMGDGEERARFLRLCRGCSAATACLAVRSPQTFFVVRDSGRHCVRRRHSRLRESFSARHGEASRRRTAIWAKPEDKGGDVRKDDVRAPRHLVRARRNKRRALRSAVRARKAKMRARKAKMAAVRHAVRSLRGKLRGRKGKLRAGRHSVRTVMP